MTAEDRHYGAGKQKISAKKRFIIHYIADELQEQQHYNNTTKVSSIAGSTITLLCVPDPVAILPGEAAARENLRWGYR